MNTNKRNDSEPKCGLFSLALDSVECLALSDFRSLCGSFYGFPWINQQSARNSSFFALCEFRPFAFICSLSFLFSLRGIDCETDQTIVPFSNENSLFCYFLQFLWECCKNNKQAKSRNIKKPHQTLRLYLHFISHSHTLIVVHTHQWW